MIGALLLSAFLEFGYLPIDHVSVYQNQQLQEQVDMSHSLYTDLGFEAQIGWLYFGGSVKTKIWPTKDDKSFYPYAMYFTTKAGLDFGCLVIGFTHTCFHPCSPDWGVAGGYDGAYEAVYVRLQIGEGRRHE
jgi:hypothetical protein